MQDLTNIHAKRAEIHTTTYLPAELAHVLCEALPDEAQVQIPDGPLAINVDYVPKLAELLQEIVAYTVSSLIDAGSEREAVMENDDLYQALEQELRQWSNAPENAR